MATLVLGSIGTSVGASLFGSATFGAALFGAAGAIAGSLIDQQIQNAIVGPQKFTGPRLTDFHTSTNVEGTPINFIQGPLNRVGGQIIYQTVPPHEKVSTQSSGGKGGGPEQETTTYSYSTDAAVSFGEGERTIKRIWADTKLIYDNGKVDPRADSIQLYSGTDTQLPNSLLESELGAGNVPAYRGIVYAVIGGLSLKDFGNRAPTFSAEVGSDNVSLATVIDENMQRAELLGSTYDVTQVKDCCLGMITPGPAAPAQSIGELMRAFDVDAQERSGVMHFFMRGDEDVIVVDGDDLGAHEGQSPSEFPLKITELSQRDIPSRVEARFVDYTNNYQPGSVMERRADIAATENADSVQLPISLSASDAKRISKKRLWRGYTETSKVEFRLPPKYYYILEGDVVVTVVDGYQYKIKVTQVDRGADSFLIEIRGTLMQTQIFDQEIEYLPGGAPAPGVYNASPVDLRLLNLPPLTEAQALKPGYYMAVAAFDPDSEWRGSSVHQSSDDVSFGLLNGMPVEQEIGTTSTLLKSGPVGYFDRASTVEVTIIHGELESVTESQVLNGVNWALIGDEILGFAQADLIGVRKYRLSTLLRGLRNTESTVGQHSLNERFVKLDEDALVFRETSVAETDITRFYRGVPLYTSVTAADSVEFTQTTRTLIPFAPSYFESSVEVNNDITVVWQRRTRSIYRPFAGLPFPQLEPTINYEIDILDLSDVVVQTISVSEAETVTYTEAEQIADGFVPGFKARIYQLSASVGRGNPAEITL